MTQKAQVCLGSTAGRAGLLLGLLVFPALAQAQSSQREIGVWLDDSGSGAVEIYVCADRADRLCGRIVWLKEPLNAQGLPKRDRFNPTESLQRRPICGLPVLGNLAKMEEGGFDGGWIYDPKAGKSYSAAIQLARQDRLTVTGYVGLKFLSKSFTWTRAPAEFERCEGAPGAQPVKAKPAPTPPSSTATTTAAAATHKLPAAPTTAAAKLPAAPTSAAMAAPATAMAPTTVVPPQPKPVAKKPATVSPAEMAPGATAAKQPTAPAHKPPAAASGSAVAKAQPATATTSKSSSGSKAPSSAVATPASTGSKSAPAAKAKTATSASPPVPVEANAAGTLEPAKKSKPAPAQAESSPIPSPFSWN